MLCFLNSTRNTSYGGPVGGWGDYNNDGFQDFFLSQSFCCISRGTLYTNSYGFITNRGIVLPGASDAAVAWADFDNDGAEDLLVCGTEYPWYAYGGFTRLYRNQGGVLTDSGVVLPGVANGAVAWGDLDNDGYLDLLLMGDVGTNLITRIYRNDHGAFTELDVGLPGMSLGSAAWGDADGDGWLDLLLAGSTNRTQSGAVCKLFHNNHDGTFTEVPANLPGVYYGSAVWGDYDNDGQLDVLVAGVPTNSSYFAYGLAYLFHNDGGVFTRVQQLSNSLFGAWGDYDNDGRLDLALIGLQPQPYFNGNLTVFKNLAGAGGISSNRPSPPTQLQVQLQNNRVDLFWNQGSDPHTPPAGLTYNVRLGTSPGGGQIVSPQSDLSTGWRRLPKIGNAEHRLSSFFTNLAPGDYYWSVQAVNHSFVGSPWAPEHTFSIRQSPPRALSISAQVGPAYSIKFSGTASSNYLLEASTNLLHWKTLTNLTAGPDGLFQFLDTTATNLPARFYRLRVP